MDKQLSIVIPFLNEKEEVENTIKSILKYTHNDIEIIIINDASDDNYDYKAICSKYDVKYIINENRIGVAASRDRGVNICTTPYVLLLDAHMRFYNNNWVDTISYLLDKNPKYLLCCQTKVLKRDENNEITTNLNRKVSLGAMVNLYDSANLFSPVWKFDKEEVINDDTIIPIPCVLGAGYACRKEYWQYLKGLNGLMYYGYDETYISIKVWLSGGKCMLLKDIIVGHIYRDTPPYFTENVYNIYNKLLLSELFAPKGEIQKKYLSRIKANPFFADAYYMMYENRKNIFALREYYDKILGKDFSFFEDLNDDLGDFINLIEDEELFLRSIANYLVVRCISLKELGLMQGRIGIVIFLFHYARHIGCGTYNELAEEILEEICSSLNIHLSCSFQSGLLGIGWGISYLFQNSFITGDINDILRDIDNKVKEIDTNNVIDFSLDTGLGGIVQYIINRIYTININTIDNPFEEQYLFSLYKTLKKIVSNKISNTDCIDVFFQYIMYYEKERNIEQPSIYDIINLVVPNNYTIKKYALGLDGNSGIGLKLIFEQNRLKKYNGQYFVINKEYDVPRI